MKKPSILLTTLLLCSSSFAASVPTPEQIPTSVDPGRVDMQINQEAQRAKNRPAPLTIEKPKKKPATAGLRNNKRNIKIQQIQLINTNQAPISKEIQTLIHQYDGDTVSIAELMQLAQTIQLAFQKSGYFLTQVILPPQKIQKEHGIIKFQIISGFISSVEIKGHVGPTATAQLMRYLSVVTEQRPVNINTLERSLLLANDIPGLQVRSVIAPGKHQGEAKLIIEAHYTAVSSYFSVNNRGNDYIGPERWLYNVNFNQLFGADNLSLMVSSSTPSPSQLYYVYGAYSTQIGRWGTQINAQTSYTTTRPGGLISNLALVGKSNYWNVGIKQPWIMSRKFQLSTTLGVYALDSRNIFSTLNVVSYDDRISALTFGINSRLRLANSRNNLSITATKGMPWFGATRIPTDPSRAGGRAVFFKLDGTLSRTQLISNRTTAIFSINGQTTNQPLLASEEIGYGGSTYGLAYDSSAIAGDKGILTSFTLQHLIPSKISWIQLVQPFLFYDFGKVWDNAPDASSPASQTGASAGIGINLGDSRVYSAQFVLAKPLTRVVAQDNNKSVRGFFNLSLFI